MKTGGCLRHPRRGMDHRVIVLAGAIVLLTGCVTVQHGAGSLARRDDRTTRDDLGRMIQAESAGGTSTG